MENQTIQVKRMSDLVYFVLFWLAVGVELVELFWFRERVTKLEKRVTKLEAE